MTQVLCSALVLCLSVFVACCGRGPTQPTPAQGPSVVVQGIVAFGQRGPVNTVYRISFDVRETGGRVGLSVTSVSLAFSNGGTATYTPPGGVRVSASATVSLGTINATDSGARDVADSVVATVAYTDDSGRAGTAAASAAVTRIPLVTISGVVTDAATGRGLNSIPVTITDALGTTRSVLSDGNGYYAMPEVVSGSITVRVETIGYSVYTRTLNVSADTRFDIALTVPVPDVAYRITGTARRCGATYRNSSGGTNQETVTVPFTYAWNGARTGDFLYMSCQINSGGDLGSIIVQLVVRGSAVQTATAAGFPNIATVSGSYP